MEVFVTKTVPKAGKTVGREMEVFVTKTIPKAGKSVVDGVGKVLPSWGIETVMPELPEMREKVAQMKSAFVGAVHMYLRDLGRLEDVTHTYFQVVGKLDDTATEIGAPPEMDVADFKLKEHDGVMKVLDTSARVGRSILGAVTFGATEMGFGIEDGKAELAHLERSQAALEAMFATMREKTNEMSQARVRMEREIEATKAKMTEEGLDVSDGISALEAHEAIDAARIDLAEAMLEQGWEDAFILESTQLDAATLATLKQQIPAEGAAHG